MASRWRQVWQGIAGEERAIWLYICKTLLALYLTAWLAMWLQMPSPSTSMLTVLIVMNRQAGLVLAKAFHRIIGTVAGCTAGVVLVSLFPQQPQLLLLAMSLWTGAMAAGALLNRNMRAYSFVLAGYTVAMIVLPSVNNPAAVFDTAIWRLAEVALGMLVASCVFDIAWPSRLRQPLLATAGGNASRLLVQIVQISQQPLSSKAALVTAQRALGEAAVAHEDLRSTAFFDDPGIRASDGLLRQLNQRYMHAVSCLLALQQAAVHVDGDDRSAPAGTSLQATFATLGSGLAQAGVSIATPADAGAVLAIAHAWQQGLQADRLPGGRLGADIAGQALQRFAVALVDYLDLLARLDLDGSHRLPALLRKAPPAFVRVTDPYAVALTCGRAAVLMFLMGLLWIASEWNSGSTALFGIVALLSMLSAAPNPVLVARQISLGHLLAPLWALGCYSLLPLMPDFSLFVLCTLPFLLVTLRIGAHPALTPLGMALNMGFMVALSVGLAPRVDAQFYLNDAVGIAIGAGLALLGFILIPNLTGSAGQRRRLLRQLRLQVALAAHARLGGVEARLESRSHDLQLQLLRMTAPQGARARRLSDWVVQAQQIALLVVALRRAGLSGEPGHVVRQLNHALSRLFAHPDASARLAVQRALQAAQQALSGTDPVLAAAAAVLAQLRHALARGHRALRAACPAALCGDPADAA